jgi:superfamily II DNA or RNA helicase
VQAATAQAGVVDADRGRRGRAMMDAAPVATTDWRRAEVPGCTLWPHQASTVIRLRDAFADGARRIMLQLPTGGGKTRIASTITRAVCEIDRPVLFVVPAIELVDQTLEKFFHEGVRDVGVMQADHRMTSSERPVQIASVQTLMRRELPPADLVFIDEGHRWFDYYRHWLLHPDWRDVPFIGLSATPWTKGLGAYYEKLIIAATTEKLIDAGILSNFKVFAPAHPDLKGVRTLAGDYHEGDLGTAMDKQPLVADIVETWLKRGMGRPTLCFAVNRLHAQHIADRFAEHGVRAGYVDCFTPANERADIRNKFASGEYQIVCNVGVLTLGVDWDVRCIILARPTKSEMLYVQIIGRGLRIAEGKHDCLILDHSDTTLRLGFVTEIHHEELHDGKTRESRKRDGIKLPKECLKCAFLRPPSTPECPNCGFVAAPVNKVRQAEGELHELRRDKTPIIDPAWSIQWQQKLYAELAYIAHARGYKRGWIAHKFKEKTGHWPNGLDHVAPVPPSDATLRWVKSRQIAYAKRMTA